MPLLVRVEGGETFGPYSETRLKKILAFARIGSSRGAPRRVEWTCGNGRPVLLRRYVEGAKTGPRGARFELENLERVVARSAWTCGKGGPRPSLGDYVLRICETMKGCWTEKQRSLGTVRLRTKALRSSGLSVKLL